MAYVTAQLFGIFGLITMVGSIFQKDKKKMFTLLALNALFFGIQYLLLGAYFGMF